MDEKKTFGALNADILLPFHSFCLLTVCRMCKTPVWLLVSLTEPHNAGCCEPAGGK